ncbi:MAG: sugar ABC transporter permease, partial [Actinobacteria bacterium]
MSSTPEQAAAPLPEEVKPPAWLEVLRRFVQGDLASLRVFVVLAVIWAIFQIENSHFLTAQNLTNLFLQITAVGLISVGVVYVLLLGEIDLSVGAVSGLAAAIMAVLNVKHGWSPYTAIAAGVVAGLVIGLVQGFFFTQFGIPSFVVTLAGLLVWQGALLKVLGSTGTVN